MTAMSKAHELLPCPFCGTQPIAYSTGIAECGTCGIEMNFPQWNRRSQPEPQAIEPRKDSSMSAEEVSGQIKLIVDEYSTEHALPRSMRGLLEEFAPLLIEELNLRLDLSRKEKHE